MRSVFVRGVYAVSALGAGMERHWQLVAHHQTGIKEYSDKALMPHSFYASRLEPAIWQLIQAQTAGVFSLSAFERMAFFAAQQAISTGDAEVNPEDTVFILSSTKGNIELLEQGSTLSEISLSHSARKISAALGLRTRPIMVSHACISGVVALQYGMTLVRSGRCRNVIVVGCDRLTKFVLSGFNSFQALSDAPCRPFDQERKGINLGEAAAAIVLSSQQGEMYPVQLTAGASTNDANHISGPSRTGDELATAIKRTMEAAKLKPGQIDMISAHGTATLYNDEMEALAFCTAGLSTVPVHSFKGFVGHTLGAAGVLESAISIEAILRQQLIPTLGYEQPGVSKSLNITVDTQEKSIRNVLKTASGFGGCNAAILWQMTDS